MPTRSLLTITAVLLGMLVGDRIHIATAQYQSRTAYPYPLRSTIKLPSSARHVGGFTGNPYRNDRVAPTGLPLGRNLQAYYGGTRQPVRGNPLTYRSTYKPFSNITPNPPLITSRDAARIEISRGLWLW